MSNSPQVEATRVISALQAQISDISLKLAILTVRAEEAEEQLRALGNRDERVNEDYPDGPIIQS